MSKGWDTGTLKKLKALMGKGLSTSEIGKRLGLSKNAVVGKLNRLGWNAKAGATPAKSAKKPVAPATKKPAAKVATKKTVEKPVATKASPKKPKTETATKTAKKPTTAKAPVKKAIEKKPTVEKQTKISVSKNLAMHQRIIQHRLLKNRRKFLYQKIWQCINV